MKIKYRNGICSDCGGDKLIVQKSKKLCFTCNRKRLSNLAEEKRKKKIQEGKVLDYNELQDFYKAFWKSQPEKICFETGKPLFKFHKWHVHHLLEKSKYPQAAFDFDNCVLLNLEQHSLWHHLTEKRKEIMMPRTFEKYLKIKEKYGIE